MLGIPDYWDHVAACIETGVNDLNRRVRLLTERKEKILPYITYTY
jgi:hypothetical protein